jgi:hypothetical protein
VTTSAAGNVTNVDLLSPLKVAGSPVLGVTVMRTHLQLSMFSAVAAGDAYNFGLIVDQVDSLVTNVANAATLLDPVRVPEADWMWWEQAVAAPTYSDHGSNIIRRDVKSKRKVEELQQTYMLSVRIGTTGATPTLQVVARTLIALP